MIFELLHAPFPDGYGEALLPLAQCKQHLSIDADNTDDDTLIPYFRDAAIEFVEGYCSTRLRPVTGIEWKAERFPAGRGRPLVLGVSQVTEIEAISWLDSNGGAVTGDIADFRVTLHGDVLPAIGKSWPSDVGGAVSITFTAGFTEDEAPDALLAAARLFLGHLWLHREAVVDGGSMGAVPFGVSALCARFRQVVI